MRQLVDFLTISILAVPFAILVVLLFLIAAIRTIIDMVVDFVAATFTGKRS